MSDIKISQLPAAAILDGTEAIPVVQGGVTKQTTAAFIIFRPATGFVSVNTVSAATIQASSNMQSKTFLVTSVDDSGSSAQLTANGVGGQAQANGILGGSFQVTKGFAANNATPQTKATVNAACIDLPTAVALLNQIRTALIANGICV